MKLVRPSALLATGDGPKIAPGWVLTTSRPGRGSGHGILEGGHLGDRVRIGARLLQERCVLPVDARRRVEERAGAHGHDPPSIHCLGRVEHVPGSVDVDGLEVGEVLAGPAQRRGAVDDRLAAGCRPEHVVGVGDVTGHEFHAHRDQRVGVGSGAGEGPHVVASLDQQLAHVGARQTGRAGHENGLGHAPAASVASS